MIHAIESIMKLNLFFLKKKRQNKRKLHIIQTLKLEGKKGGKRGREEELMRQETTSGAR